MSKVDWSLAPDDATHFGSGEDCGYWVKVDKGTQYFINISRLDSGHWKKSPEPDDVSLLVERPRKQWSGPEDGLPPVNSRVEIYDQEYESWVACEVYAHTMFRGEQHASAKTDDEMYYGLPQEFRAIPTPEQIRESAIRELMDIAQVDCRVTAARLVDAGFKREVV